MLPRHLNKEDMSLHCTMCHRSCETGSSSSFALTSVKFTWDVTKTPLMGAGAKFPNAVPCCKFFLWKVGARWVVLAIAWCWGVLLKGEQPFQWAASSVACLKRSRQCSQLPECGNERGISFPPFVSFLSHFSFFCYMHHFFFSSAWYGSIVVVLLLLSAHVHLYLSLPGQKQKAVNKSKLGLFLFVLSNAQFLLEVALSGCVPSCLFSSSSAPCGCTRECVCCVCKCAHVSQVCNM